MAAAAAAATMSAATISSPASVKVESDAIKVESEITIATIDEQSSLELPALDAQHLDLSQSYLNDSDQAAALEAIKYEEENDENIEVKVEVKTEAIKTEPPSALPATIASTKSIHAMNAIFGGETKGKKRPNAASIQIPADRSPKKPLLTPNSAVIDEPQQRQSIHSQQPHQPSQQQQQQLQATPSTVVKVGDKMLGNDVATVVTTAGNVSTMPITGTVTIANYSGKQMKAATLSDLEGIDMMHLPVDLDDSGGNIDILSDIDMKPELVQETHACFLSLIRDIFCSTPDHRTTAENLRARVSTWLANPLTALNDWFSEADSWLALLTSAIHFLAGEFIDQPDEFVPYVEYKANLHIYQWIGAGRDNDQHLRPLCDYWLKRRNEMGTKPPPKNAAQNESLRGKSPRALAQSHVQQRNPSRNHTFDIDLEDSLSSGGGGGNSSSYERVASPPPPRFPTEWTVQKATPEEIFEFREQERRRFDSPHLSFCYRMHGYESVVGPVKGIYTQIPALTKARGHNMLTVDRPNFVTILTLVRDATARLPNGEGTRADICELLKSSQYICPTAAENVLQTIVSGALDRMHTEHDPCVRYDAKRKIWIYLHRNRTEEEFDRMHQQYQGHSKHKKQTTRKNKSLKTAATLSKSPNEILSSDSTPIDQAPSPSMFTAKTKCVTRVVTPTASISPTSSIAAQVHVSTSATSPPLPALSSIQVSPTLTNKMITVQKMPLTKPELVPIQVAHDTQLEPIEVEATHEVSTSSPVTVQKPSPRITMQLPSLIVDKTTSKMGAAKPVGKPTLNLIASNSTQIKVSTPSGIQTVHVSAAGHALIKPPMTTILTPSSTQSILSANQVQNRSQSPLRVAKTQQQLLQSKVQPPPLIAQSTPPNVSSYMIPISLSGKTVQSASIIKSISPTIAVAPKITKTTTLPALTNAHVPRMSLLQTQQPQQTQSTPTSINVNLNKTIIRNASAVPAGKSLISPTLQQQSATLKKQICSISASDLIFQQQQQQTPKFIMASAAPVVSKTNLVTTSQANAPMVVQKIMAVSKAASGSTATSTAVGTITPPGTSLINPHIIQIHQTNQKTAQTLSGTGAKVPVGFCETTPRKPTLGLTPAQQQNLLQSIKQRAQSSPQSLIIKQQQVLQQIQKQMQQPTTQIQLTSPPKSVGTAAGTSLLGTQIQLTSNPSTSMIITGGTTTQPTITRTVKAGTSLIQQANQTATTTTQLTTSPITAVRTVSANNPLVGKVLTDASGQIISLESLLQKQVTVNSAPTLRLTGSKPGQTTNLIQLAGTPGSQITQYAVVSQGRNLISMAQPRVITTQAGGIVTSNAATATINSSGQLVAVSGVKTVGGISVLSSTATSNSPKTDIVKIGGRNVVNSKFKTMVAATTTSTAATQPVMRYKTTGGTSIRIMNASNLIHIGGKPVIIASKSSGTTLLGQSANQTAQQHATASAVVSINEDKSLAHDSLLISCHFLPSFPGQFLEQFRKYSGSGTSSSGTVTSTANTNNFVIGGQMVKVQGNFDQSATTVGTTGGVQSTGTAQNVMFGNQIVKLQAHQPTSQQLQTKTIVSSSGVVGTSNGATTPTRTVVLSSSGQTLKVHSPTVISTPSSVANSAGGTKVTVATSSLPSTQQVVLGSSNLKVCPRDRSPSMGHVKNRLIANSFAFPQ